MIRREPVSTSQRLASFVCSPFVAVGKALYNTVASVCSVASRILNSINPFSNRAANEIRSLEGRVTQLETQNKGLITEKTALLLENQSLRRDAAAAQTHIEGLLREIEVQRTEYNELVIIWSNANHNAQEAKTALEDAKNELASVQTQNNALESDLAAAEKKLASAKVDYQLTVNKLSDAIVLAYGSNKKLEQLKAQLDEQTKHFHLIVNAEQAQKQELADSLTDALEENKTLRANSGLENGALITQISDLGKNLKNLNQQLATVRGEKAEVETQLVGTKDELEACRQTLASKTTELHRQKQTAQETDVSLKQLHQDVFFLKTDIEAKKTQIEQIKKGSSESTDQLRNLEKEYRALEQKFHKKEGEVYLLEGSLNQAKSSVENLTKTLKAEQAKASRLEKEFNAEEARLQKDLSKANFKLNRQALEMFQLLQRLETSKGKPEEIAALEKEIARLKAEIENGSAIEAPRSPKEAQKEPVEIEPSTVVSPSSPVATSPVIVLSPSPRMSPHADPFVSPAIETPKSPKEAQKEPVVVDEPAFVLPAPAISINEKDITPVKNAKAISANLIHWRQELLDLFEDEANLCCNLLALQKLQALNGELDQLDVLLNEMEQYVKINPETKHVPESMKKTLVLLQARTQELNGKQKKDLESIAEEMIQMNLPLMVQNLVQLFNYNQEDLKANPLALEHLNELMELQYSITGIKKYFEDNLETKDIPAYMMNRIKQLRQDHLELGKKYNQVFDQIQASVTAHVAGPSAEVLNDLRKLFRDQKEMPAAQIKEVKALLEEIPALETALQSLFQANGQLHSDRFVKLSDAIQAQKVALENMLDPLTAQMDSWGEINRLNFQELEKFTSEQGTLNAQLTGLKETQGLLRNVSEVVQQISDPLEARKAFAEKNQFLVNQLEERFAELLVSVRAQGDQAAYGEVLRQQKSFTEFKENLAASVLDLEYAKTQLRNFVDTLAVLETKKTQRDLELNPNKGQEEKKASRSVLRTVGSLIWG